jgi:hypothetical protein
MRLTGVDRLDDHFCTCDDATSGVCDCTGDPTGVRLSINWSDVCTKEAKHTQARENHEAQYSLFQRNLHYLPHKISKHAYLDASNKFETNQPMPHRSAIRVPNKPLSIPAI